MIGVEQVKKALVYYRSAVTGSRPLSSMNNTYRFISTANDLTKLREFERDERVCLDRQNQLHVLCDQLREVVFDKMSRGIVLHDTDIQEFAREINKTLQIPNFNASIRWVQNFKSASRIVSRHITKIISRRTLQNQQSMEQSAQQFVRAIKEMNFEPSLIVNADQSGFVKEMQSGRSLAPVGVKTVERMVQTVSSTTHSYTVMPMIYADGRLGSKLFVVLQEPKGSFPQRFNYQSENLSIHCHTSYIMTKQLMITWFQECVFTNQMPDNLLLIVDHWSSFRDHETIQSYVPLGKNLQIRNIPAGATPLIQPLDVFFFRFFKGFVRKIHGYVMAKEVDFQINLRNNILLILELVYHQFCNPIFNSFLLFSWFKAGYSDQRPEPFLTPIDYCFPIDVVRNCQNPNCANFSFIRCSYCNAYLCFDHFIVSKHKH